MTLRIETLANGKAVIFALSGRLDALGLVDLQRLFDDFKKERRFVLDLNDLRFVDRFAVKFLGFCELNGMRIENCPPYIRDWISREQSRSD